MATAPVLEEEVQVSDKLERYEREALEFAKQFSVAPIEDAEGHDRAAEALRQIVSKRQWWKSITDPAKDAAHKAHAAICKMIAKVDAPLANLELQYKACIKEYERQEEQRRLAEEARIRESLRLAAESQNKEQAEEEQINAAIAAEEAGDKEAADAILSAPVQAAPVYVPPVIMPKTVAKQAGITRRKNWTFRIVDESRIPRQFLCVDEAKLRKYAKAMEDQARVPGVEFYDDQTIAVRV